MRLLCGCSRAASEFHCTKTYHAKTEVYIRLFMSGYYGRGDSSGNTACCLTHNYYQMVMQVAGSCNLAKKKKKKIRTKARVLSLLIYWLSPEEQNLKWLQDCTKTVSIISSTHRSLDTHNDRRRGVCVCVCVHARILSNTGRLGSENVT